MNKLDELIALLCPNGVKYQELAHAVSIERGKRVVREQLDETGLYPVYQNSLTPLGYHSQWNYPAETTFLIVAGAAGEIGYSTCNFWAADDCFPLVCGENLSSRYLYHVMLWLQPTILSRVRKASIPRLSRDSIERLTIPVPPLEVQCEIVRILDTFTELTSELTENLSMELTARKQQYTYYRDNLLNSANTHTAFVPLGELFPDVRNGFVGTVTPFFSNKETGILYLRGTNIHNGVINGEDAVYVSKEFHSKHKRTELKPDDIIMVQSGHVGDCAVVGENYAGANCHALIVMSNGGFCNSKYIVHYLHSSEGKKKLDSITTGGTLKHILASKIKEVVVPLPSLDVQNRIVTVLDNFDAICTDLNIGLPAEIEARKKQYEYYRDKLLSFTPAD